MSLWRLPPKCMITVCCMTSITLFYPLFPFPSIPIPSSSPILCVYLLFLSIWHSSFPYFLLHLYSTLHLWGRGYPLSLFYFSLHPFFFFIPGLVLLRERGLWLVGFEFGSSTDLDTFLLYPSSTNSYSSFSLFRAFLLLFRVSSSSLTSNTLALSNLRGSLFLCSELIPFSLSLSLPELPESSGETSRLKTFSFNFSRREMHSPWFLLSPPSDRSLHPSYPLFIQTNGRVLTVKRKKKKTFSPVPSSLSWSSSAVGEIQSPERFSILSHRIPLVSFFTAREFIRIGSTGTKKISRPFTFSRVTFHSSSWKLHLLNVLIQYSSISHTSLFLILFRHVPTICHLCGNTVAPYLFHLRIVPTSEQQLSSSSSTSPTVSLPSCCQRCHSK